MKSRAALLAVLLLCGCGGPDPVADEANNAAVVPVLDDGAAAPPPPPDGSPPAAAKPAPEATAATPAQIPAFLHGRWGMTPADCTSTRGDAKGLLVISDRELRFYESRAVPAGNATATDHSFSADFTFTGEGQTWSGFETLQIQNKRLVRTTSSPMASYTYAECS